MRIISKIIISSSIGVLLLFALTANGQQAAQHSQYMYNYFYVNPGVAGTGDYSPLMFTFRDQWAGFPGAPVTYSLSTHTPINDKMGVGLMLYNDKMDAISNTGLQVAYAYRIAPTEDSKISFGLSGHFSQLVLNAQELSVGMNDENDPELMGKQVTLVPDVSFGVFYSIGNSFAGISANDLMQGKLDWGDNSSGSINRLVRHYYILAGQKFEVGEKLDMEGSLLFKSILDAPFQIDINFKTTYNELVWGGFSYRHQDAVVVMVGVMKKQFRIGYSYDVTLSDLKNSSSGTSEIFMSIHFRPFNKGEKEASFE